jgi:LCP family protein required for cell wall assembly
MRRKNVILWVILAVGLGAITIAIVISYRWNKPLGPQLGLPTLTPSATALSSASTILSPSASGTQLPNSVESVTQSPSAASITTPQPTPTETSQPLCNGPAKMTLLLIGSDQRGTSYLYGLADSIYVAYIDFAVPKVMVIDFPRDLWVEIPGISDHHGITHGKINQAYLFGNPGMGYYDGPGEGPGLLARTLDQNFGLRVDHYIAIDMSTFIKVIDAVGGVDVTLEAPVDLNEGEGTPDPKLYLSAGTHHLDGNIAMLLARNRIPSTFQRTKYQRMILSALREKVLTPEMITKLPGLAAKFITTVQTDLSPNDISSLLCLVQAVPKENIQADSFPQDMFTATVTYDQYRNVTTFIYEADFDQIRKMMAEFTSGIWPFHK